MSDQANWKLKDGAKLDIDEVAKIACALKSLSVYTAAICEQDDSPQELEATVQEGLDAIDRLFDY